MELIKLPPDAVEYRKQGGSVPNLLRSEGMNCFSV